jgi:hypothetical protein
MVLLQTLIHNRVIISSVVHDVSEHFATLICFFERALQHYCSRLKFFTVEMTCRSLNFSLSFLCVCEILFYFNIDSFCVKMYLVAATVCFKVQIIYRIIKSIMQRLFVWLINHQLIITYH